MMDSSPSMPVKLSDIPLGLAYDDLECLTWVPLAALCLPQSCGLYAFDMVDKSFFEGL